MSIRALSTEIANCVTLNVLNYPTSLYIWFHVMSHHFCETRCLTHMLRFKFKVIIVKDIEQNRSNREKYYVKVDQQ